ncbi:MAG: DUF6056 family protein [Eubacterium sp.]|nr:DUF6056 family protein [Eubacterium sp.]
MKRGNGSIRKELKNMENKAMYYKIVQKISCWCKKRSDHIDRIPMKRMAVYAGICFVLSLLPLLWLGRYNVMCIDDYDYGRRVHDVWIATGSIGQSVKMAWQQNMDFYQDWQGTYVSCFLMALCPMNFHYKAGYLVPVLMIGMFAVSTFALGRHILCKWLGTDQKSSVFVMFVLLFMFYQVLEAPYEGIYWYNGATHYVLMQSVWFFTATAISMSLWSEKKSGEAFWCVVAAVLAVIVGGGNLVTGLQAEVVMALLVVYAAVMNRKKVLTAIIPFLTGTAGFLVNTMAPGNFKRGSIDTDVGYPSVVSILLSFYHAVVFMIRWTTPFVILVWLMLLPVLWKSVKRSAKTFRHPVWVTLGAFCVLSAMFTPTLFAVGMVGLSRVDNIIQMVYYLCLVMVTAYWLGYFSHRTEREDASGVPDTDAGRAITTDAAQMSAGAAFGSFLEKTGNRMTAVFAFIVLVMWICTADKNTYTSVSALRSVVNGEAETFYEEAMERHEIYTDENITEVELKPYSACPAIFEGNDLSEDAGNWLNLAVMQYYHKAYVKIVGD